jgi:hypothetical protein
MCDILSCGLLTDQRSCFVLCAMTIKILKSINNAHNRGCHVPDSRGYICIARVRPYDKDGGMFIFRGQLYVVEVDSSVLKIL